MVRLPVRLERPILDPGEQDEDRVLPRAHVPDRRWALSVASEPGGRQRIERHALGAAGEERLGDPGTPIDRLHGPDVEVLARVRRGHDRDLRRRQVERLDAARLEEGDEAERLDRRAQGDDPVGVAEDADDPSGAVDLDDVTAMLALGDPAADLADEDRRGGPRRRLRRRPCGRPGGGAGRRPASAGGPARGPASAARDRPIVGRSGASRGAGRRSMRAPPEDSAPATAGWRRTTHRGHSKSHPATPRPPLSPS